MPRHDTVLLLNTRYTLLATAPDSYSDTRLIGVDHLTGVVLEQRVALEACRAL